MTAPRLTVPQATAPPALDGTPVAVADTPTVRGFLRRTRTWIVLACIAILAAIVLILVQGGVGASGAPLGADSPGPAGAKALVEVLRDHGVDVDPVSSLDQALAAADSGAGVLVSDAGGLLEPESLAELADVAERLVVVAPDFAALGGLADGVRLAGAAGGGLESASCALPAAERAGSLSDGQRLLSLDGTAREAGWEGCFPDGDFGYALVTGPSGGGSLTIVGAPTIFANDTIDEAGNAALAIGLTGAEPRLAWYLPGLDDLDPESAPTLAELTPGWVSPVAVLLLVVALAAAVWRGRRFGPLVVEDLPVEVPASETREGRARLYARSSVRVHALDQLRIGALGRLAALLKLPHAASAQEIAAAAAVSTGRDPRAVDRLLVDALPAGDRELVDLAGALGELEEAVRRSLHPDATTTDRPGRTT